MFLIKKFIIIALVAALILPCLLVSGSAAPVDLNYEDYITDVQVDGDLNIVTCSFPASPFSMTISPENTPAEQFKVVEQVVYAFDPYQSYDLFFIPGSNNFIYLGNLPDDTELNVWVNIANFDYDVNVPRPTRSWEMNVSSMTGRFYYYDSDHKVLNDYTNYQVDAGIYDSDGVNDLYLLTGEIFDNPDDYNTGIVDESMYMIPRLFLTGVTFSDYADVEFHITEYEIVFHIDSLIMGGEYGEVLDSINKALLKQGKKIDEITGEIVYVALPPGSELIDENAELEKIILELGGESFGDSKRYLDLGAIAVAERRPAFLAVSSLLNRFIDIPFFKGIIVIGIGVGVFGFSVNLAFSISRFLSNRSDSGSKSKDKSGSNS